MGRLICDKRCSSFFIYLLLQLSFFSLHAQKLSFTTQPNNRVAARNKFSYTFSAMDSANRIIEYSCTVLPSWISFDKATNTLSGITKKTGQYLIQINATTKDAAVKQNFMLTVYDKKTKNILPLGNSITNGTSIYNSYRRSLWQLLHNGNYNFDFIGSWDKHHMGGAVPDADFDMDHDGHSGWKAHDILQPPGWDSIRGNIDNWLEKYKPDIVLMELGTNEVFQCTPIASAMKDFSVIIDKLRRKNPSVKILLAKIPPLGAQWASKKLCGNDTSYEQSVQLFNEAIVQFAHAKTKKKSPIIIVDQFTGVNPSADMYDDIHPNTTGEIKMAERWFETMKPFLKRLKRNN